MRNPPKPILAGRDGMLPVRGGEARGGRGGRLRGVRPGARRRGPRPGDTDSEEADTANTDPTFMHANPAGLEAEEERERQHTVAAPAAADVAGSEDGREFFLVCEEQMKRAEEEGLESAVE